MCKVIAIANQKGGVGKTTTCVNLGIGLAREGKRVLLIEADAQGSMAASLGIQEPDELEVTLVTIMEKVINDEDVEPNEGIIWHDEGIAFIPANIELTGLETALVNVMSREMILKQYLDTVKAEYGYILIDCITNTTYGKNAAWVVVDGTGKLIVDQVTAGFDETVKEQIISYLHPQETQEKRGKPVLENWKKSYENGEYLRSAEITEEQNYNMIDGRMNNLPTKPRKIGTRTSVLDRLHLKQADLNAKNLPQSVMENEIERKRK